MEKSKVCYVGAFSLVKDLRSGLGINLCPSEKEEEVYLVNLCLAFRQIGGVQRACVLSAPLQLLLAQNNPYAKVAYFGVVYSCYPSSASHVFFCKQLF